MGDRSFILGDRSSEKRKGDRSLCVMGRSLSVQSAHFEMVEMDKIVSKKRGWVTPASTQPTKKDDRTNGEQQSHLFLLY
ncbi:hypothetical protein [Microcoleus sp. S11D4]|uniref:hypothetical protein n=1 Tax=Microcoleus sp. S11D4 TaxID=3055407 RepID=UPI002FD4DBF3